MRTVVTGGAGFIGSHVVDALIAQGHSVVIIDDLSSGNEENLTDAVSSGRATLVQADIADIATRALISDEKPEVIFHLAAQPSVAASVKDPVGDAMVNVVGTINVLEAAVAAKTRKIVYAASGGSLFGDVDSSRLPAREDYPRHPLSHYAVSKAVAIDYMVAYEHLYGLTYTALGLANVYGPRQNPHGEAGVVAIFSKNFAEAKECTIYGNGNQTRDYVFVLDVAKAFIEASGSKANGQYVNIGTATETSVSSVYATLADLAGSSVKPLHAPERPGDIARSSLAFDVASKELGWRPETSIYEGLAATFSWFAAK